MHLRLEIALDDDVPALIALKAAVAGDLATRYGQGPWSRPATEKGVRQELRTSKVFVARDAGGLVATLRLATKKPWAIHNGYFTSCKRPLYLLSLAVLPGLQGRGIGRFCLEESRRIAQEWPADAIRLDAYDSPAGAGGFYARCGFAEVGRVSYRGCPLIYYETVP